MSTLENLAYDAVHKAAYAEVNDVVQGIIFEILNSTYIVDDESLQEAIHTAVDSAITYTVTQWVCAWGLCDSEDDFGFGELTFDSALTHKAYANLLEAVNGRRDEFIEAMKVAEDKRMEKGI